MVSTTIKLSDNERSYMAECKYKGITFIAYGKSRLACLVGLDKDMQAYEKKGGRFFEDLN
jgi:hypothetical protein